MWVNIVGQCAGLMSQKSRVRAPYPQRYYIMVFFCYKLHSFQSHGTESCRNSVVHPMNHDCRHVDRWMGRVDVHTVPACTHSACLHTRCLPAHTVPACTHDALSACVPTCLLSHASKPEPSFCAHRRRVLRLFWQRKRRNRPHGGSRQVARPTCGFRQADVLMVMKPHRLWPFKRAQDLVSVVCVCAACHCHCRARLCVGAPACSRGVNLHVRLLATRIAVSRLLLELRLHTLGGGQGCFR